MEEISEKMPLNFFTVRHHVMVLVRVGIVFPKKDKNFVRFFLNQKRLLENLEYFSKSIQK